MAETACLLARFGFGLQAEGRLKEAEFVQKLALRLEPHQYFTTLPLAATYHETGRHAEALPLFEQGLARFKDLDKDGPPEGLEVSPSKCLGTDVEMKTLRNRYQKMYKACLKAAQRESPPS
jgi:tetratricopeptide (TPR) repeat protein